VLTCFWVCFNTVRKRINLIGPGDKLTEDQINAFRTPQEAEEAFKKAKQGQLSVKALAEKIYSFADGIEADPKTGKHARDIKSFSDFFDIDRLAVALGENSGQLALFIGATLLNPVVGGAFMFAVESGDATRSIDIYERETGKKLDNETRVALVSLVGGINMALELVPLQRMLNTRNLPGLRKKVLSIILTTLLESSTEGAQEVTQLAAEFQYKGKIEDLQAAMQQVLKATQAGFAFGLAGGVAGAALSGRDAEGVARRAVAKQKIKEELAKDKEKQGTTTKSLLGRILGGEKQLEKPKPEGGRKATRLPAKELPGTVIGAKLPSPEKIAPTEPVLPEAQPLPEDLTIEDLKLAAALAKNPDDFLQSLDDFQLRPESVETFVKAKGFKDIDDFFTKAREEKTGKPATPASNKAIDDFVKESKAEPAIIDNQGVLHSSDTANTIEELLSQLELNLDDIADTGIITEDGQFVSRDKLPELAEKLKPKPEKTVPEKPDIQKPEGRKTPLPQVIRDLPGLTDPGLSIELINMFDAGTLTEDQATEIMQRVRRERTPASKQRALVEEVIGRPAEPLVPSVPSAKQPEDLPPNIASTFEPGKAPNFDFIPKDGWRNHLIKAREYANALNIVWTNVDTKESIVRRIDEVLGAHLDEISGVLPDRAALDVMPAVELNRIVVQEAKKRGLVEGQFPKASGIPGSNIRARDFILKEGDFKPKEEVEVSRSINRQNVPGVELPKGWSFALQPNFRRTPGWKAEVDWKDKRIVFETEADSKNPAIINHEIAHILIEDVLDEEASIQKMSEAKSPLLLEFAKLTNTMDVHPNLVRENLAIHYGDFLTDPSSVGKEFQDLFNKHFKGGEKIGEGQTETQAQAPDVKPVLEETKEEIEAAKADVASSPQAGEFVDGLKVRDFVPNQDSIAATFNKFEIVDGIREVNINNFVLLDPDKVPQRAKDLAQEIKASGEINPLIVAIDDAGPYFLEGSNRIDALVFLGKKRFPAMVVLDREAAPIVKKPEAPPASPPLIKDFTKPKPQPRPVKAGDLFDETGETDFANFTIRLRPTEDFFEGRLREEMQDLKDLFPKIFDADDTASTLDEIAQELNLDENQLRDKILEAGRNLPERRRRSKPAPKPEAEPDLAPVPTQNIDDAVREQLDTDIERDIFLIIRNSANEGVRLTNANLQAVNPAIAIEQLQEKFEKVQVIYARAIILRNREQGELGTAGKSVLTRTYNELKQLYDTQPLLNARTSQTLNEQQFSTPIHLAYLMGEIVGVNNQDIGLDTTAGNGALLANFPAENALGNELTQGRFRNLQSQGIKAQQKDATGKLPFPKADVIIINPPFNNIPKTRVQGFVITKLEHQIAMNALTHMKDDGRASILLGGNAFKTNFGKPSDLAEGQRIFLNFLHSNYNVTGHFNLGKDVFGRQGTTFPTQLITIHGRRKAEKFAPANANEITDIQSLDQLREIIERRKDHGLLRALGLNELGRIGGIDRNSLGLPEDIIAPVQAGAPTEVGGIVGEEPTGQDVDTGIRGDRGRSGREGGRQPDVSGIDRPGGRVAKPDSDLAEGTTTPEDDVAKQQALQEKVGTSEPKPVSPTTRIETERPQTDTAETQIFGTKEQNSVVSSKGPKLNTTMPSNTVDAVSNALSKIPDVDTFVKTELQYKSTAAMYEALGAEQIDDVALAITKMKNGGGMIIGDQTGIGKGRVAASLIRWSVLQGRRPIFFTYKAGLFTDIFGDLNDIGSGDLKPFIFNGQSKQADPTIRDQNGKILFKPLAPKLRRAAIDEIRLQGENAPALAGTDIILVTYSQVNVDNNQRQALMKIIGNADLILDESHNAAGASQTGAFFIDQMIRPAKGVAYLSATYAKRPDNLPVYSKTILGTFDADTLEGAFEAGGVPLQEVVAAALAGGGEYIRHERTWEDVDYSVETIASTPENQMKEKADDVTEVLRALVGLDEFIREMVRIINIDIRQEGERANVPRDLLSKAASTPFASRVHNLTSQLLLSLKIEDTINRADAEIKAGRKPIIALSNTMESFLNDFITTTGISKGDEVNMDFTNVLEKALRAQLVYKVKHASGEVETVPINTFDFPESAILSKFEAEVDRITEMIGTMFKGLPANPIDMIKEGLKAKGHRVGELTGRQWEVIDGRLEVRKEIDKFSIMSMFNGNTPLGRNRSKGEIDVLVVNRSASTGISLHASEKFGDQRQRVMLMIQPDLDINQVMQMFGRIFRTGQVHPPIYRVVQLDLPTEMRPAAVLTGKMASLNANVSADQESATSLNAVNFFNEIGTEITRDLIREMTLPEQFNHFGKSWDLENDDTARERFATVTAQKATGWLQLAEIDTQTEFLATLTEAYNNRIDELTARGINPLIAQNLNYKAKLLNTELVYSGDSQANPLSSDAHIEELEVDILKQPLTRDFIELKIADPAREESREEIKKLQEQGSEWYRKRISQAQSEGAKTTLNNKLDVETRILNSAINQYPVGSAVEITITLQEDLGATSTTETFTGVVTEFKHSKTTDSNPIAPSKNALVIGTNDPNFQKVTVPLSQIGAQLRVQLVKIGDGVPDNWEDTLKTGARETVMVWTGNLFAYYATDNSENNNRRNMIVRFTTEDGKVREGIVLRDRDLDTIDTNQIIVRDINQAINYLQQGNDLYPVNDPNVEISFFRNTFEIKVPDTRARGSKYFGNEQLLSIVNDRIMTPTNYNQNGNWRGGLIGVIQSKHLSKFKDVLSKEFGFQFSLPRDFVEANKPKEETTGGDLYSMGIFPDPRAVFKYLLPRETSFGFMNAGRPSISRVPTKSRKFLLDKTEPRCFLRISLSSKGFSVLGKYPKANPLIYEDILRRLAFTRFLLSPFPPEENKKLSFGSNFQI